MGILKNYYVELMNSKANNKKIELTKDVYYVDKDYVDYLERKLWKANCENGRLKEEIINLKNHQTFEIHELDGNITHLKLTPSDDGNINKKLIKKDKEIKRLNNIINEIEKYCIENVKYDEVGMKILDQSYVLDKLQELKEGK